MIYKWFTDTKALMACDKCGCDQNGIHFSISAKEMSDRQKAIVDRLLDELNLSYINYDYLKSWQDKAKKWDELTSNSYYLSPNHIKELEDKAKKLDQLYYGRTPKSDDVVLNAKKYDELQEKAKKYDEITGDDTSDYVYILRSDHRNLKEKAKNWDRLLINELEWHSSSDSGAVFNLVREWKEKAKKYDEIKKLISE